MLRTHRSGPESRAPGSLAVRGNSTIARLAALGLPVYCGGPRGHELALTFDDGPGVYTHYALKKLARAHEGSTFFDVGRSIDGYRGYLGKELGVASIGDHTYTHPNLTHLGAAQVTNQIASTKIKIERASGQPVNLFRPPYGARNTVVDGTLKRLGMLDILWSVDSADSLGADYAQIIKNVEAGLRPGAIVELHENRGQTIRALTTLLPELRRRHLRSVSLPELFATDPPSVAQVRRGGRGCGSGHAGVGGNAG